MPKKNSKLQKQKNREAQWENANRKVPKEKAKPNNRLQRERESEDNTIITDKSIAIGFTVNEEMKDHPSPYWRKLFSGNMHHLMPLVDISVDREKFLSHPDWNWYLPKKEDGTFDLSGGNSPKEKGLAFLDTLMADMEFKVYTKLFESENSARFSGILKELDRNRLATFAVEEKGDGDLRPFSVTTSLVNYLMVAHSLCYPKGYAERWKEVEHLIGLNRDAFGKEGMTSVGEAREIVTGVPVDLITNPSPFTEEGRLSLLNILLAGNDEGEFRLMVGSDITSDPSLSKDFLSGKISHTRIIAALRYAMMSRMREEETQSILNAAVLSFTAPLILCEKPDTETVKRAAELAEMVQTEVLENQDVKMHELGVMVSEE